MKIQLLHGDCLEVMRGLPPASVDAIVTDPPYGLSFMGKRWDYDVPSVEVWAECLRVLKPGAHLLAFAGTRTQHRMAVRIEDAGFEIRDMVLDAIGSDTHAQRFIASLNDEQQRAFAQVIGESSFGGMLAWVYGIGFPKSHNGEWGGTALKPALEPITVARKPLVGTVEANWREHGTGALNIDGCRVPGAPEPTRFDPAKHGHDGWRMNATGAECAANASALGRWPANLIHDGSEEVLAAFPDAPGQLADASSSSSRKTQNVYGAMRRGRGDEASADSENDGCVGFKMRPGTRRLDSGSAARFFYCAKASAEDRHEGLPKPGAQFQHGSTLRDAERLGEGRKGNHHPTVKPTDLMRYLCRLVTPAGGVVLDPFMGSGSTGKAAVLEGLHFIGIELDPAYVAIARARIEHAARQGFQPSLLEAA